MLTVKITSFRRLVSYKYYIEIMENKAVQVPSKLPIPTSNGSGRGIMLSQKTYISFYADHVYGLPHALTTE
jgi:hypothetical protein